jgi:uncharacterized RDD family membrane protein YckC
MATVNPYAAPKAAVGDVQSAEPELATRWQRFWAAFVDGIVITAAILIAGLAVGLSTGAAVQPASFGQMGVPVGIALAVVALINLWMLSRYRATIGKKALKIKMVRKDGSDAGLGRLIFLRGLPQWIVSGLGNVVPLVGILSLVDILFIFGKGRRCVHDYIADTIVVKVE